MCESAMGRIVSGRARMGEPGESQRPRVTPEALARLAVEDVVAAEAKPHAIASPLAFDPGGVNVKLVLADPHDDDRSAVHGKIELLANDALDASEACLDGHLDILGTHPNA